MTSMSSPAPQGGQFAGGLPEELMKVEDVAAILKVKTSWVYAHIRRRRRDPIPHLMIGRYVRFEPRAVREWTGRQRKSYSPGRLTN